MSQYIGQIDKEQRQLKLMGVQAAEKIIGKTKEENLKLLDTQRKGWADILKAASKTGAGFFGNSKEGRIMEMFVKYAPLYAKGSLDEEAERYFLTGVTDYTQRKTERYKDPDTDRMIEVVQQNRLPDFVQTALATRPPPSWVTKGAPPTAGATSAQPGATVPSPAAAPSPTKSPMGATERDLPADVAPVVKAAPLASMFDLRSTGTGFLPVLISGVVRRIPFDIAGQIKPEYQQGTEMLKSLENRVVNAMQENPRFAEGEREMIKEELRILPKFFTNEVSFGNQLIAIDNVIEGLEEKAKAIATADRVGSEKRKEAAKKLLEISTIRDMIGILPNRLTTPEEVRAAAARIKEPTGFPIYNPDKRMYEYRQIRPIARTQ